MTDNTPDINMLTQAFLNGGGKQTLSTIKSLNLSTPALRELLKPQLAELAKLTGLSFSDADLDFLTSRMEDILKVETL